VQKPVALLVCLGLACAPPSPGALEDAGPPGLRLRLQQPPPYATATDAPAFDVGSPADPPDAIPRAEVLAAIDAEFADRAPAPLAPVTPAAALFCPGVGDMPPVGGSCLNLAPREQWERTGQVMGCGRFSRPGQEPLPCWVATGLYRRSNSDGVQLAIADGVLPPFRCWGSGGAYYGWLAPSCEACAVCGATAVPQ